MPRYLRYRQAGGTFFFTVVTFQRRRIFVDEKCRELLRQAIVEVRGRHPFHVEAWVLLPDHLHCIWTLPAGEEDFSERWRLIKGMFSWRAKALLHQENLTGASRRQRREVTVWQRRFWDHRIRNDRDFRHHFDYLHYNPVKHGLVRRVSDWPFSTFQRYVRQGIYPGDWGGEIPTDQEGLFGE